MQIPVAVLLLLAGLLLGWLAARIASFRTAPGASHSLDFVAAAVCAPALIAAVLALMTAR